MSFVKADATALPFERDAFDLAACHRTLHHVSRPELVVSELARVTCLGGRVLVIDQIAPADPLAAIELDRFERARDASHTRLLSDIDIRSLARRERARPARLEDGAGIARPRQLPRSGRLRGRGARGRQLAWRRPQIVATIGWYLAAKPMP